MALHVCFVVTVLNGRVPEGACVAAVLVRDPMGALVIPMASRSGIEAAFLQIKDTEERVEMWSR